MQSFKLTKGYFIKVVLILLIILILIAIPAYISGFFPLASLLIIVTYPFVSIILAVTYRKLVYSHQDVDDDVSESI
jgi:membrane protein implicated in regulation of membrane protease activity